MKAFFHPILTAALLLAVPAAVADELPDSVRQRPVYPIEEVVVTGTRNETDVRLLPMTVSVVDRAAIERSGRQSLLPILTEQVPGLFATARGIMGYGVSTGAAGGMSLRGIGGAPQAGLPTTGLLVLIDGHPQYMGLMGHPIADAYQSMLAERVEVVRGPASVLYGSNAMGGVINIVTRKQREEGIRTAPTTRCRPSCRTVSARDASRASSPAPTTAPTATAPTWASNSTAATPSWDTSFREHGRCRAT